MRIRAYNPGVNLDTAHAPPAAAPVPPHAAPFVGREREISALCNRLAAAVGGGGGVALVSGEPGIGKSRLLAEFAGHAQAAGWRVLRGRAYETEGMPPYLPFTEAIDDFLRMCPLDDLSALLGRGAPDVARLVPEVRDYLPEIPASSPGSPEAERYRLFESVSAFLLAIARAQAGAGLLLLLDDLHCADRPTLLLLSHLARRLPDAPFLVVGSYRTTEVDRAHPLAAVLAELHREGLDERVALTGLTVEEVAALVAALAGRPATQAVVAAVYRETEGNPFFVGEIVRHLLAEGRDLTGSHATVGRWSIPEGVREVIGQRLARLAADTHRLLQTMAVAGGQCSVAVLDALHDGEPGAPADALEEAVAAGMLREEGDGFRFTHALIRETLYGELSLPRRQRLHRRAAEAIEWVHARNLTPHLAALAAHYRLGGVAADPDKALDYSRRAAAAARAVFAWEEAARELQAALALVGRDDAETRCDLLLDLGETLISAREPLRVAEETAPEAFTLAERRGDAARATRACEIAGLALLNYGSGAITSASSFREWAKRADRWAAPGTVQRVRADALLAYALQGAGRYRDYRTVIARALSLARDLDAEEAQLDVAARFLAQSPSPEDEAVHRRLVEEFTSRRSAGAAGEMVGWLLFYGGWVYLDWGERERATDAWRELAALAARTHDPVTTFFAMRAEIIRRLLEGELAAALAEGDRLTALAREQGSPVLAWFHSSNLLYRPLLHAGRAEDALARAAIPEAARALGLSDVMPPQGVPEALCLAHMGRHAEARRALRMWVVEGGLGDADAGTPTAALTQWLETAVLTEDREMADLLAQRLAGVASLGVGRLALTCVARHLGGAAALLGRVDEARRHYEQALEVGGRIGFRPEVALARLGLAELCLTHRPQEAAGVRESLAELTREFEAMGMHPALARVGDLPARFGGGGGGHRRRSHGDPDALTEREVEVLRLLAAGKSNREIGAELVLSVRTVERHITNIYAKIGAHSRTRAVLYAQEHGFI
jgi:DNA-binding CsgD family transcriptional regulator